MEKKYLVCCDDIPLFVGTEEQVNSFMEDIYGAERMHFSVWEKE